MSLKICCRGICQTKKIFLCLCDTLQFSSFTVCPCFSINKCLYWVGSVRFRHSWAATWFETRRRRVSLWKAAMWNWIQGRFSAAAGSEVRFNTAFAKMTGHITLQLCVHMRLAFPVTYVTLRLSYSESWPSSLVTLLHLEFSRPQKVIYSHSQTRHVGSGWIESCSRVGKETFYDWSYLFEYLVITRAVLRRQAVLVLRPIKVNSPIWMPLVSNEAQKWMTPSKPISLSKLPLSFIWNCWCRYDPFCWSAPCCLPINQGNGPSKRLNRTFSRASGSSFVAPPLHWSWPAIFDSSIICGELHLAARFLPKITTGNTARGKSALVWRDV